MTDYFQEMRRRELGGAPNHLRMARFLIDIGLFEESLNADWPRLPQPATHAAIISLLEIEIKKEGLDCSICLVEFKKTERAKKMPCQHIFHSTCLLTWLQQNNTCPFCRHKLPTGLE
ncbi:E3 ubiquitin-protein ligase RNF181-like [Epargyreus clarus]|uniref:E3 ubiquitin-protein ligase RNF181-like n=1 Tax=Epargyreus clarus TaxID=520877 RepID=UPI003C2F5330